MNNPFSNKNLGLVTSKEEFDRAKGAASAAPLAEKLNIEIPKELKKEIKEDKILNKKAKILAEFGGIPSNIPINHPYWKMR